MFIIVLFTIFNIMDFVTALHILPGESNPIYILTGSIYPILFLKILVISLCVYVYIKNTFPSKLSYFSYVYVLIIGSLVVLVGVTSNIIGMKEDSYVSSASEITDQVKINYYIKLISIIYALPFLLSVFAFYIYDKTEKFIRYKNAKVKVN